MSVAQILSHMHTHAHAASMITAKSCTHYCGKRISTDFSLFPSFSQRHTNTISCEVSWQSQAHRPLISGSFTHSFWFTDGTRLVLACNNGLPTFGTVTPGPGQAAETSGSILAGLGDAVIDQQLATLSFITWETRGLWSHCFCWS